MKTIILSLFLLFASGIAISQEPQNPVQYIRDLKEGVLVVRLRTQAAKIAKLEELMQAEDPESMMYNRLAYQLGQTRQKAETENRLLVQAFKDQYRFSPVLFLYDTLAPLLKNEDPSLNLEGRFFLVAGIGTTDASESASNKEALILYDRRFDRVQRPFPGVSGVTSFRIFLESFSTPREELEAFYYQKIVEKLNKNLFRYYGKVNSQGL